MLLQVKKALEQFAIDYYSNGWFFKEREAVSAFALGYLSKQCVDGQKLYHPAQIGIEFAVPQQKLDPTKNYKAQVCKDVVVWDSPFTSCWDQNWDPVYYPDMILEWKADISGIDQKDKAWLIEYSKKVPDFVGMCVTLNSDSLFGIDISDGRVIGEWRYR